MKYEIGRNRSVTNLINLKWSSVRIKGTGYDESRKSIVKIEPCNGISNMGIGIKQEYINLKSPTDTSVKNNIGNVSYVWFFSMFLLQLYLFICLFLQIEKIINSNGIVAWSTTFRS